MTALTKDRLISKKGTGRMQAYPVAAATKIYSGSKVCLNTGGYAVPAADAAGYRMVGVATALVDNSAGSNGDLSVVCESGIVALFNATSITQAMVGKQMFVVDDNTFDDTQGTNGVLAGILLEYHSSTSGSLFIPEAAAMPMVLSVLGGLRVAYGQHTTVAASDTKVTGLTTVVAALAVLDSDPIDDPEWATASIGDQAGTPAAGSILIKTWKNTSGTDPTPAAATTFTKKVNWIAFGI